MSNFSSTKESGFINMVFPDVNSPDSYNIPAIRYALLSQLIGVDFYNELRTQKQMGYMAHYWDSNLLMFFPRTYAFVVSNRYKGKQIESEVNQFLSTLTTKIKATQERDFNKVKQSLLSKYMGMLSLDLQAENEFNRSFLQGYIAFDKRYSYLKGLDFQTWMTSVVASYNSSGVLNVLADASIKMKEMAAIEQYHKRSVKRCIHFH